MAETILFAIAKGLLGELGSFLGDEIGLLWCAKKDLKKLKSSMSAIKAVLLDAEEKQRHNDRVRDWLQKLEVVVYDADDLVDDLHIEALRRRVMPGNKLTKKVCIFFSSSNQLAFRLKMGHKIKEIREALDEIKDENTFQLAERVEDPKLVSAKARETHSFVRKEEVFGRDGDKLKILELLLHGDETEENISIITIVGIGGLGKTTLAQLVFNGAMIEKHFKPRLWVCVSEVFDLKVIAGDIIKSATNGRLDQNLGMDQLQLRLREQIDGKRYFLVLDDVWNEDPIKWLELKSLLKGGARGSRVLVTTRSEKVAMITHSFDDQPIHLSGLDKAMSWSLFKKMAFRQQQDLKNKEIVDIGKAILDKCKGVPLAIKTIGSILYFKNPVTDWLLFKDNELATVPQQEDDIIPTLKLSYNHLPSYLKHCFAYCSLFPKDHEFDVQMLIRLWMAQGFIKADQNECLEDIGYGYFLDLLWRSFFQEAEEDERGNIRWCKMHDLMHDLAISVVGNRSVLIDKDSINFSENLVHASFVLSLDGTAFLKSLSPLPKHNYKLRTLFCDSYFDLRLESNVAVKNCREICSEFKSLRALGLYRFSGMKKLPKSLGELKHLRYLDLSRFSEIEELPNSITKLQNLQTLNLERCEKLSSLPRDMHKMVSLRHLVLDGCDSLSHMPSRLGELTCLQTLDRFVVGAKQSRRKKTRNGEVGELRNLNSLRGVLRIENLRADIEESENPNLQQKQHLRQLVLWFGEVDVDSSVEKYEKSLELLQPHANIKSLEVKYYMGVGFASWVKSLVNLVELELDGCRKCRYLPPLHVLLPCLQKLYLVRLDSLEHVGLDRYDDDDSCSSCECDMPFFPSLTNLEIEECPKLTSMLLFPYLEWLSLEKTSSKPLLQTMTMTMAQKEASSSYSASSSSSFQSLSKLVDMRLEFIDDVQSLQQQECPNLTSLPEAMGNLSSLKSLYIEVWPNLKSLPEAMGNLSSLQSLHIGDCPNLTSLPEAMGNLSSLQSLYILNCPNLTSLPEAMGNLSSLQSLHISHCPNLTSLPKAMGNLSSLQSLYIYDCPNLTSLPEAMGNLSSLQSLYIGDCPTLTSLPEAMGNLSSLQSLHIIVCPNLTSLPEGLMFRTLTTLLIFECPILKQRYNKTSGEDWPMIAHIPYLCID